MGRTFEITISGQVQGVGFRPFVYGLAQRFGICGTVCNNEMGVLIHINASEETATEFVTALLEQAPGISIVRSHHVLEISYRDYKEFKILPSHAKYNINSPLTPDFAICDSCKADIRDKNDRRYGYAFTTCTNCGPRYALTTRFPFERANTTVSAFEMCNACQAEYSDAGNRRFHSQTNSCPDCGIQLKLTHTNGEEVAAKGSQVIEEVTAIIRSGSIIALKNTSGYLLCCDANNEKAIKRLRKKKQRPAKPFALLYPSLEKIKKDFQLSALEEQVLTSSVAPILILEPKHILNDIATEWIAPGLNQLGVMLPSSALLTLLMDAIGVPIVATSGNIHGSPIISEETDAVSKLSEVSDYFLHHDLKISFPQDDSVVRITGEEQLILRRSRGLAPNYLETWRSGSDKVLAMGAHLKSTFSMVPNAHTYVSPYFGNLDSYDVVQRYRTNVKKYQRLFGTAPEVVLVDSHPQYQSSIIGKEIAQHNEVALFSVQHHKAHFASVLGEHGLFGSKDKILGVVWDGTGYGDDGAIWGGEFFKYKNGKIVRLAHFEYVTWIAADKMSREPRLSLLSMLPKDERKSIRSKFSDTEWNVYHTMLKKNGLQTSSVGRLFDAAASLLNIADYISYEGEAAMLLEKLARDYQGNEPIDLLAGIDYENVPSGIILKSMFVLRQNGVSQARLALSFIHTLSMVIIRQVRKGGYKILACSGGVFQNAVLVEKLSQLAEKQGVKLKINRILSTNDENVSFGQLCYYEHIDRPVLEDR